MLDWVMERTRLSRTINNVVVAITLDSTDDALYRYCLEREYLVSRGSTYDVLDRYYRIADQYQGEIVVRITSDCPFIDPTLVDEVVGLVQESPEMDLPQKRDSGERYDFAANRLPLPWGRTYPIGLDVEVFTFNIFREAWIAAIQKHQREHVTPYFYEDAKVEELAYQPSKVPYASAITPKGYHLALLHHTPDYGHLRWTVDTPEDLELARGIAAQFSSINFGWRDILAFIQSNPSLSQINAHIQHKTHLDVDQRIV